MTTNHFVYSRQCILVDSHVKLWVQALEWVLLQLQSADHIRMILQQSFGSVYWNEVNPVLASLGQIIQNRNYPILDVLDAVNHICPDLLEVFHWVLDGYGIETQSLDNLNDDDEFSTKENLDDIPEDDTNNK